ncbi:RNA-binding protein Hfq [Bacillus lacus]|uniref:RNA-binding protein Hfq n=1 Tax=Metabacillus lacus TaxID=1983721 RepID=A0A7X2IXI7_9BACI|nr:RNA chaperone Hfq [Metabacillus lacus]MRX71641.1 RNA-binding protein Hfq [Metabacillus lacus]
MKKQKTDHQEVFFAKNLDKTIVLFTKNGVRITGNLKGFDQYSVLLEVKGEQQLLFKSNISTLTVTDGRKA